MTTKLVRGTPVISLADGASLGVVDHVYLDRQRLAIVGFTLRQRGGLLGGGPAGLVDVADVHAFGPDAVTIDAAAAVRSEVALAATTASLIELEALLGREVVTDGGRRLGRVAEVVFDEGSHQLLALELAGDDGERRRAPASSVATIGDDLVIVAEPAARVVSLRPARERGVISGPAAGKAAQAG